MLTVSWKNCLLKHKLSPSLSFRGKRSCAVILPEGTHFKAQAPTVTDRGDSSNIEASKALLVRHMDENPMEESKAPAEQDASRPHPARRDLTYTFFQPSPTPALGRSGH